MIELEHKYSTKSLAEALGISYDHYRKNRQEYEAHLAKFYVYTKSSKGNAVYYTFEKEMYPYVPYREYKAMQKSSVIQKSTKRVIEQNNRQTGSNVARIIVVDEEIQVLGLKLSTLTVYVRDELKALVDKGYYIRDDYRWCYLNKAKNEYILMSDEEVSMLRDYFNLHDTWEQEENILSAEEQGSIKHEDAATAITVLRKANFIKGRQLFQQQTGFWPIKVPVYVRAEQFQQSDNKPFNF